MVTFCKRPRSAAVHHSLLPSHLNDVANGCCHQRVRSAATYCAIAVISFLTSMPSPAKAEGGWERQEIDIQAGWNLIWLLVDPAPSEIGALLDTSAVDWAEVHTFVPGRALGSKGSWASAYRNHPPVVNSLSRFQGNRGYLVLANSAGTLSLTGRPIKRQLNLSDRVSTLFGVSYDPSSPAVQDPTFLKFFSHPSVTGRVASIYSLDSNGNYVPSNLTSTIARDKGYWGRTTHEISYWGPIRVNVGTDGIQFGKNGYSRTLAIEVPSGSSSRNIEVRARPSEPAPSGEPTDAAGGSASWLEYLDPADLANPWKPLSEGVILTVPGNETKTSLEIRCVRKGRTPTSSQNLRGLSSSYQAVIEIQDSENNQMALAASMEIEAVHGVWIGQARLTNVSLQMGVENPPCDPASCTAAQPLTLSLILALPGQEGGPMQLLDKAYIDVDRDGRTLQYRFNSILFHEPVTMAGEIGDGTSGTLIGTTLLSDGHALNPYRHRYHPEHRTGYEVSRAITMTFAAEEQDPLAIELGLGQSVGDNELVGTYEEVISGLSVQPITVSGPFKLHRLSNTTDLN